MSLLHTGRRGVYLLRAASVTDRRGDTAVDFTDPTRVELIGASVQQAGGSQASSSEDRDGGRTVVTRWVLFCTREDITANDRVEWRGRLFEVDGSPNLVENQQGYHHTEASLILMGT